MNPYLRAYFEGLEKTASDTPTNFPEIYLKHLKAAGFGSNMLQGAQQGLQLGKPLIDGSQTEKAMAGADANQAATGVKNLTGLNANSTLGQAGNAIKDTVGGAVGAVGHTAKGLGKGLLGGLTSLAGGAAGAVDGATGNFFSQKVPRATGLLTQQFANANKRNFGTQPMPTPSPTQLAGS